MKCVLQALVFMALIVSATAADLQITTVAGGGPSNEAAVGAALGPTAMASDGAGGYYVVSRLDSFQIRLFHIDLTGRLSVFAGVVGPGEPIDGGSAIGSILGGAGRGFVIRQGFAYLGGTRGGSGEIWRLNLSTGVQNKLAGCSAAPSYCDQSTPLRTKLGSVEGITLDPGGNPVFAEAYSSSNRVRRLNLATNTLELIAGNGIMASTGDGGPATLASLNVPYSVSYDQAGNLYIAELNGHRIRVVRPYGTIGTFAGTGQPGFSGDGGLAVQAQLNRPQAVLAGPYGLYISDTYNNRLRYVDYSALTIATIAGNGRAGYSTDNTQPLQTSLGGPDTLALDYDGGVLINEGNTYVSKLSPGGGLLQHLAGVVNSFSGDGGPATSAVLGRIKNLSPDGAGGLILHSDLGVIRRVDLETGIISTIAGGGTRGPRDGLPATEASFFSTYAALVHEGKVYVGSSGKIYSFDLSSGGTISTFASGTGEARGMVFGPDGNLYFSDAFKHCVSAVDVANGKVVRVVAGQCQTGGYGGDGGDPLSALMKGPYGLAFDDQGRLYIAEEQGHRIRRVDFGANTIATVAGTGRALLENDGGDPLLADLNKPTALRFGPDRCLYLVDSQNKAVRKIDFQANRITTIFGKLGWQGFSPDGTLALDSNLLSPEALTIDVQGVIYITDLDGVLVRKLAEAKPIDTTPPIIHPNVTGTAGANGWYISDVMVQWVVSDPETGISSSSGCQSTTVLAETAETTITCTAVNGAGLSTTESRTIKIDRTQPVMTSSRTAANSSGWNNTDVTVTFDCTDTLSGVDVPSTAVTWTEEGADQSVTGVCQDRAGNSTSISVGGINIDKTAPALTLDASMTVNATSPGGAAVTYLASVTDALDPSPTLSCTPPSGSFFEIKTTTVSCNGTDRAGNIATGDFQVKVLGPAEQITNLMNTIVQMNLGPGTTSLLAKLDNVNKSIEKKANTPACNQLDAFLNEVAAQTGKSLTVGQATQLTMSAAQIRAALGC